jgi:hypothetical protein
VPAYITLTDLKNALGIPEDDDTVDTDLEQKIRSASASIEDATGGRSFGLAAETASARTYRTHGRLFEDWQSGEVGFFVDDIGSLDDLTVELGSFGGSFSPIAEFDTGPENALARRRAIDHLLFPRSWACAPRARLRVTARWGWPAIPDQVVEATLIQAARLYKRKDSPEGVTASSDWGPIRVTKADPDVKALLSDFVIPAF